MTPICPYCQQPTELTKGKYLYPKKPELATVIYYACKTCKAWARVDKGTGAPMGRIANAELRQWKGKLMTSLDSLRGKFDHKDAKRWLADGIQVTVDDILWFDVMQCQVAVAYIENNKDQISNDTPKPKKRYRNFQRSPYSQRFK